MRRKIKTVMEQMNAEKPDDVLADLERKHGCAAPSGSAATCEWLSTLNTEETCNKPATHERMMGKPVRYCTEHAMMLAKYTELRTIKPPNSVLSDPCKESITTKSNDS
jgi:hypothetical protein